MSPNLLVLIFSTFICSCFCQFEFKDHETVRYLSLMVAHNRNYPCITILRPLDENRLHKLEIEHLIFTLLKNPNLTDPHYSRLSVMAYTTEEYLSIYLNPEARGQDSCISWVTIVMVTENTQQQLEILSQSYLFENSLWLLFVNGTDKIELHPDIKFSTNLLMVLIDASRIDSYTFQFMHFPGMNMYFDAVWQKGVGYLHYNMSFIMTGQMANITLNVGALQYPPFLIVNRNEFGQIDSVNGFYGDIWNVLAEVLEFKSVYVEPREPTFGKKNKHGNWTGLYGLLERKEADVLLNGMGVVPTRSEVAEFLHPIETSEYKIFYKKDAEIFDWFKIFRPFEYRVWCAIIIWVIVGGISFYLVTGFSFPYENRAENISLIRGIFFVLRSLSNQGSDQIPKLWALRVLMLTCYFLASLILPSYSASLISVLTLKTPEEPFARLEDILTTDYKMSLATDSSDYDFLAQSKNPMHRRIIEEGLMKDASIISTIGGYESAIEAACVNKKTVFFGILSETTTIYRQQNVNNFCLLLPLKSKISKIQKTIAISKHFTYRTVINSKVMRLREFGIISRHERLHLREMYEEPLDTDTNIGLIDVGALFVFLILLQGISILILCFECCIWKIRINAKRRQIIP